VSGAPTSLRAGGRSLAAGLFLLISAGAQAVALPGFTEELDATRTEAWAMRWFAAVATPTMFGVASETEPWSFDLGVRGRVDPLAFRGRPPRRLQRHQGRGL
jgi:hypothetical protein